MTTVHLQTQTTITEATATTGVDIANFFAGYEDPIAGYTSGVRVWIRVYGLDSGASATIAIESSADGTFDDTVQHAVIWLEGPIGSTSATGEEGLDEGESTAFYVNPYTIQFGTNDEKMSSIPWDESGAALRVNVSSLTGGHLTYESYFTY